MTEKPNTDHPFYFPIYATKHVRDTLKVSPHVNEDLITYDGVIIVRQISQDKPPLIGFQFYEKLIIVVAIAISLSIGSFFKGIMYTYMFKNNKNNRGWMHRPINVLTISSAVIHHLTHVSLGIWYVVIMVSESPLGPTLGYQYCQVMDVVGVYAIAYLSVGSLGIAIYRVLYMKYQQWVKFGVGEIRLLWIVLSLSVSLSGLLVFLYKLEPSSYRFQMNACNGESFTYAQILIDYGLASEYRMINTKNLQKGSIAVCISIQSIELIIYVWFFYTRYKNDNGNIKSLLGVEIIRDRNIKNVSTFLGQFYCFLIECTFLVTVLVIEHLYDAKTPHIKAYVSMVKLIDFGVLSAVEVFSSPSLRAFMR